MAIKFYNIRSGETAVAESEPHISAMWSSSDHSPNITQGQDFGWRMAPEVVIEMKEIKQDIVILTQIAARMNKPVDDITEPDILSYISSKTTAINAPVADGDDYADAYDAEIRRLSAKKLREQKAQVDAQMTTTTTTESLADMEKRAELLERIQKAQIESSTTTTTTTVLPKKVVK